MKSFLARWRCRHGHHDLEPLRGPGMLNVGACKRCGVITVREPGAWSWLGPSDVTRHITRGDE